MTTIATSETIQVNPKLSVKKELKNLKKDQAKFTKAIIFTGVVATIMEMSDFGLTREIKHGTALVMAGILIYSIFKFRTFSPRIAELKVQIQANKDAKKIVRTGH